MDHKPEGMLMGTAENQRLISSAEGLLEALEKDITLEARALICTSSHDLIVALPCASAVIPREEAALGIAEGTTRDIAIISRVNKPVCFKVREVNINDNGSVSAVLSRRAAQEECMREYISGLRRGDIIEARITHLEQFGCFVDIGCGLPSLIPIDAISVSRISHPSDRFHCGQLIRAVVKSNENGRVCLTHKELLGTWEENAERFSAGEAVPGIVRSVEEYGIFVELAPNLAGLAEPRENISQGERVSVYIKAILPDKMKIKLVIVDVCEDIADIPEPEYFITEGHISEWRYSVPGSDKEIVSRFDL